MSAAVFEERVDPGKVTSAVMALAVHLILFAILVFGIRWQNRPAESVAVELWTAPPAPVVEAPRPEPKPEPAPPVVVKPEPEIPKPQIVERKAPPPKPKAPPKPEPKVVAKAPPKPEPKPVVKPEPLKPRVDDTQQRRFREELAREAASEHAKLAASREGERIRDQLARDTAAARAGSTADWVAKIRNKVLGRIVVPADMRGNPEALFVVLLLPTGEVLDVKLSRSSGHRGYDEAVERAIRISSPLPKPDKAEIFQRELRITFSPRQ